MGLPSSDGPGREHADRPPDLSIVIPTYNERERLGDLVGHLTGVFASRGLRVELIIVDDNSPDGTGDLADALSAQHPLRVLHRPGKLGLGSAVVDGFAVARSEVLGVMDADLSHPPEALCDMFAVLGGLGADAVIGSRYIPGGGTRGWPVSRLLMSRLACVLARGLTPVKDATSGLFLIRHDAVRGVEISAAGFKICLELLVRGRARSVAEVPYTFVGRTAGQSKMNALEAFGYLSQLAALYRSALRARAGRGKRYRRLSPEEVRRLAAPPSSSVPC